MSPDDLRTALESIQSKLSSRGYDVRPLVFEPPASSDELTSLESRLGAELPPSLRKLLQEYSRRMEFSWFAPDDVNFPKPFQSNFCGDLHWSLESIEQFDSAKSGWIAEVFPNPDDPYDAVWHNKLAFYEVGNGDYLAVDMSPDHYEEVVYLSHDDGEGHGYRLAPNVIDLLHRWVPLACTGGEDWQWLPFTDDRQGPINPEGDEAGKWRWILGLSE
jgi:hypothetical protein